MDAEGLLCSLFEPVSHFLYKMKIFSFTVLFIFSRVLNHNSTCITVSWIVSWNNKQSRAGPSPDGDPPRTPSWRSEVRCQRLHMTDWKYRAGALLLLLTSLTPVCGVKIITGGGAKMLRTEDYRSASMCLTQFPIKCCFLSLCIMVY